MLKKTLIILIIGAIIYISYDNFNNNTLNTSKNITKELKNLVSPGTPIPFAELTIPYLRDREYKSSLNETKDYLSGSNYTSYLTSYYSDGLKINALLTKPKGDVPAGGFPAIVFVHGYIAPTIYRTTERYVDYVNYLARNGFVVLKIDLRGHGDSEGNPGGSYYSGDYVVDTLNAYSALQNTDFVNPKKIGLWGHSMAGNVTFRSLVAKRDIPAVVIWGGAGFTYSDLLEYRISDRSYRPPTQNTETQNRRKLLNETHGTFNPDSDFWKQVTPINYLDGVRGAIALHHAVDDETVNVEYSRNLNAILNKTGVPHELYEYQSGGHNITGSSFSSAMQRTVDFYKKNLNSL